jgi:hypothetical protein
MLVHPAHTLVKTRRTPSGSNDGWWLMKHLSKRMGFRFTKIGFTSLFEECSDGMPLLLLYKFIKINKVTLEEFGQAFAGERLARTHKSNEVNLHVTAWMFLPDKTNTCPD